jgi:hypothetical protein
MTADERGHMGGFMHRLNDAWITLATARLTVTTPDTERKLLGEVILHAEEVAATAWHTLQAMPKMTEQSTEGKTDGA